MPEPLPPPRRLNLGAGSTNPLDGYENWDRKTGQEAFPLAGVEDGSVDVIRASHVLEHFSHRQIPEIVGHWVQKLRPGGCLKIAVPNFEWIAKNYLDGKPINVMGYTMGGHTDVDDHHGALFDDELLHEVLANAGLERIGRWKSEVQDCAALEVSLNLEGYKPSGPEKFCKGVTAVLSAPRFGPMAHAASAFDALLPAGVPYYITTGAYWQQILCEGIEQHLEESEFILTLDFDSMFRKPDVLEIYRLALAYPEAHAICGLQNKRGDKPAVLFGMLDKDGKPRTQIPYLDFNRNLTRIHTGHFGFTLFRSGALKALPRPWMTALPNKEGRWGDGKIDADISFWHRWREAGFSLHLANRIVIGHLDATIAWPGSIRNNFAPVYQCLQDYLERGLPAEVDRCGVLSDGKTAAPGNETAAPASS